MLFLCKLNTWMNLTAIPGLITVPSQIWESFRDFYQTIQEGWGVVGPLKPIDIVGLGYDGLA